MDRQADPFGTANRSLCKTAYVKFHHQQRRQQILRSQMGFLDTASLRPLTCEGCIYYHGVLYGPRSDLKTLLICALYPKGWEGLGECPDWHGASPEGRSPALETLPHPE
jgi:hypothetical protein